LWLAIVFTLLCCFSFFYVRWRIMFIFIQFRSGDLSTYKNRSSINSPYNIFNSSIPTHPKIWTPASSLPTIYHLTHKFVLPCPRPVVVALYTSKLLPPVIKILCPSFLPPIYVRPLLEYGSVVWSNTAAANITKLKNVQRFFTNKITGCCYRPYKERLKLLSHHRHRSIKLLSHSDIDAVLQIYCNKTYKR